MDQHNPEDRERERSEPCSTRTNPFIEQEEPVPRKRQKTLKGSPRGLSVDTTLESEQPNDPSSPSRPFPRHRAASPHTPPNMSVSFPTEPTSSRVTINLRTTHSSQESPVSSQSPSTLAAGTEDARTSVETESDALSTILPIETPSSSPSRSSSPQVEVVDMIDVDSDYNLDLPVTIIGDDNEEDGDEYEEVMEAFPGSRDDETEVQSVLKVARHFQYGMVFCHTQVLLMLISQR